MGDAHEVNKGDDLDKDSIASHIQFCERKSRRTAVNYPWQRGFMASDHFGGAAIFGKMGPNRYDTVSSTQTRTSC